MKNRSKFKVKLLSVLLIALLAFSVFLTVSCDDGKSDDTPPPDSTPAPTVLASPAGLAAANATLSWTAVENSSGYAVSIDNAAPVAVASGTTTYSLADLTEPGYYAISVKAKGDGTAYADSAWPASISYVIEATAAPTATPLATPTGLAVSGTNLTWTAVTNANGYFVKVNNNSPVTVSTGTSYSLATLTTPGSYALSVKARGNGTTYADSAWPASVGYTVASAVVPPTSYDKPVSYSLIVDGFEWGPSITKVVISVSDSVAAGAVNKDTFVVKAGTTTRTIVDAYISDTQGNKQASGSSYNIAIEMFIGYTSTVMDFGGMQIIFGNADENASPFSYDMASGLNSWAAQNIYTVTLADNKKITIGGVEYPAFDVEADQFAGIVSPLTDGLTRGKHTKQGITLQYAAYSPEKDSNKNPLVIWLHGAGEGGTDVDIALLGNDVTELMKPGIQNYFVNEDLGISGAYVLAVQSPTMWMDNGNGQNHAGDQPSIYTDALLATIKSYVSATPDVDANRIYIGGCSNGGYMTMNMLLTADDGYFAAAYPVCQAYMDSGISDAQIAKLADTPIWFTAASNDTTVTPANYSIPTYARLMQAGAENAYFSYFTNVTCDVNGSATQFNGHWSWIYSFRDECTLVQNGAAIAAAADLTAAKALITPAGNTNSVMLDETAVSMWGWLAAQGQMPAPPVKPTPPSGDGEIYGAAAATLTGTALTLVDAAAANGGKAIQGGVVNNGDKVSWTFNSTAAAKADLFLSVSSSSNMTGAVDAQPIGSAWYTLTVNGTPITSIDFEAPGGGGTTFNDIFTEVGFGTIDLVAGSNVIELTFRTMEYGVAVSCSYDYMKIVKSGGGAPTGDPVDVTDGIFEAEYADLSGVTPSSAPQTGTIIETGNNSSNASLGYLGLAGNKIVWNFTADAADDAATLKFNLGSGVFDMSFFGNGDLTLNSTVIKITVNGTVITFSEFIVVGTHTMSFNLWQICDFGTIAVKSGTNVVEMEILGATAPNLDYMKIDTTAGLSWAPADNSGRI